MMMKMLALPGCLIFFFILPLLAEEKTFQGTVILYDESDKFFSYGVMVAQNNILLPNSVFSPEIDQVNNYVYVDDFNERMNQTSLMYYKSDPSIKRRLSGQSKQYIRLNNDFIVLYIALSKGGYRPVPGPYGGPHLNDYDLIPGIVNNNVTKLSRYSLCTNESALYTINNPSLDGAQFLKPVEFKTFTDEECAEIFPKYNPKNQICGPSPGSIKHGTPLFETIDSINYFIGFPTENQNPNVSLFNLFLNKKCSSFPTYEICDSMRPFTSQFVACNSIQTAQKLKTSDHPEVVLVGTNIIGELGSFVPLSLGIVISDNKLMVFNDVKKYIENYQFYGHQIELAIMSHNIHGETYEDVAIDDNDNTTSTSTTTTAAAESIKMFALLKFKNPVFNKFLKAKIVIHETITDRVLEPSPLKEFDNLMGPAFDEKTGEFVAFHEGNTVLLNDSVKKIIIDA